MNFALHHLLRQSRYADARDRAKAYAWRLSPSGTTRKEPDELPGDPPAGSVLWVQEKLVALKVPLSVGFVCDGLNGPLTKVAVAAFQKQAGFVGVDVNGQIGPKTLMALEKV